MSIIYRCSGWLIMVLLWSTFVSGQDPTYRQRPRRIYPPDIDGYSSGFRAIDMYDDNDDGALSGKELDKCPGLKAAKARVDANQDGKITPQEITDRIHAWQQTRTGLTSCACKVTHKGRPLVGAEVKFVPEKFLGNSIKAAEGTTNKRGMTMIAIPGMRIPGLALGMYRVEITKNGEKIPAKYNTDTILGQEIANDNEELQEALTYDLDY